MRPVYKPRISLARAKELARIAARKLQKIPYGSADHEHHTLLNHYNGIIRWYHLYKHLSLLLLAVVFCSCESTVTVHKTKDSLHGYPLEIATLDSCEYLIWGANALTHKGNCKFCTERNKK